MKTITPEARLQLIGLLALAEQHNKALRDIRAAALAITDERDQDGQLEDCGHTSDAVYSDYGADQLLGLLDIEVVASCLPEGGESR